MYICNCIVYTMLFSLYVFCIHKEYFETVQVKYLFTLSFVK